MLWRRITVDGVNSFVEHVSLDLHEYLMDPSIVGKSLDLKNDIREAMAALHRHMLS